MTKALTECAKCHVSDDHFEFGQLRGTCLGTGLTESTKYSAWDLGLPEITVYTTDNTYRWTHCMLKGIFFIFNSS